MIRYLYVKNRARLQKLSFSDSGVAYANFRYACIQVMGPEWPRSAIIAVDPENAPELCIGFVLLKKGLGSFIDHMDHNTAIGLGLDIANLPACLIIDTFAVHQHYREKGIGARLMAKVFRTAISEKVHVLITQPIDIRMESFFGHYGFKRISGQWDRVIMALRI